MWGSLVRPQLGAGRCTFLNEFASRCLFCVHEKFDIQESSLNLTEIDTTLIALILTIANSNASQPAIPHMFHDQACDLIITPRIFLSTRDPFTLPTRNMRVNHVKILTKQGALDPLMFTSTADILSLAKRTTNVEGETGSNPTKLRRNRPHVSAEEL
jgi:hypothetical protein